MARATPDAPATYFRLSDETWAMIVEEYANGATAKQLGAKWKVAPNSIYRHVGEAKMTKRDCGDQRARAHARAVTLAAKARDAKLGPRAETVEPALGTLFEGIDLEDEDDGDPLVLAQVALRASGRAMRARLWVEAKALAGLAESYGRLGDRMDTDAGRYRPSPQDDAALAYVLERLEAEDREAARSGEGRSDGLSDASEDQIDTEGP